jgi:hypothetical protein
MTMSGENVWVIDLADDRYRTLRAAIICLFVMTVCLPTIIGQMQINPQPQIGPRGGGSMRYPNAYMQTKALPSESRGAALASGMMRSEHRYARMASGPLPSAGRFAHLTPTLTSGGHRTPQYARRPAYGTVRHTSATAYGQSLPWRQQSPMNASRGVNTTSSRLLASGTGRKQPSPSPYQRNRPNTLGTGGYGTLSYRGR